MHQKFPQSSKVLRVFALVLTCLFCAAGAMSQEKATAVQPSVQPQTASNLPNPATKETDTATIDPASAAKAQSSPATAGPAPKSNESAPLTKSNDSPDTAASSYHTSLAALSTLYQSQVQRLEQKNNQSKELYEDGLISRVDMEASDKALADARAKVEDIGKQIATANQPAPVEPAVPTESIAADKAWSTGNGRVDNLVRYYGSKYGVDPYLIFCLMHQESRFTTSATSPKGAQGLMQLMPGTAARYGVTNPYDMAQSIMGGTRYLKDLLTMFNGRIDLALAGYNAGENAVVKHGYTIPPYEETRNYVKLIIKRYGKKQASSVSLATAMQSPTDRRLP